MNNAAERYLVVFPLRERNRFDLPSVAETMAYGPKDATANVVSRFSPHKTGLIQHTLKHYSGSFNGVIVPGSERMAVVYPQVQEVRTTERNVPSLTMDERKEAEFWALVQELAQSPEFYGFNKHKQPNTLARYLIDNAQKVTRPRSVA